MPEIKFQYSVSVRHLLFLFSNSNNLKRNEFVGLVFIRPIHTELTDTDKCQQTHSAGFVRSLCYSHRCLLALVAACFCRLNMLNQCLLGLEMSETRRTAIW